jgi:adenosylcobinamide-phosphate synthase
MIFNFLNIEGLAVIVLLAYALDLLTGDPLWLPHPIRWIGALIALFERFFYNEKSTPFVLRLSGALLSILVVSTVFVFSSLLLYYTFKISLSLFFIISIIMAWSTLSTRSLHGAATSVKRELKRGRLACAREKLAMIVGRDTTNLTPEEIERALIETVSENTSDGIIAPLFFLALGGPPLALAYKAVNTLDSMLGYKSERYLYFGWFPARLDDLANLIPARLTASIMVVSSFILGFDWRSSLKVVIRDGRAHPSPNAGLPEAAVAGAVGMRLGGVSLYNEKPVAKPVIGSGLAGFMPNALASTIRIMHLTGLIMVGVVFFVSIFI